MSAQTLPPLPSGLTTFTESGITLLLFTLTLTITHQQGLVNVAPLVRAAREPKLQDSLWRQRQRGDDGL